MFVIEIVWTTITWNTKYIYAFKIATKYYEKLFNDKNMVQ